jgi:Spy/CpxP family protein refolding chaperone
MKTLHRMLLPAIAAGGLLLSAPAVWSAPPDAPPGYGRHAERMEQYRAELQEKLKLTPQQEGAWKTFSEKMKPAPWPRRDRAPSADLPAPERMEQMLARMKEFESHMAERLAAVKEFYAVLTPEQRKVFDDQFNKMVAERSHHRRS